MFQFSADQTDSARLKIQRRKSYNATGSAKKKPNYKPYTGKTNCSTLLCAYNIYVRVTGGNQRYQIAYYPVLNTE